MCSFCIEAALVATKTTQFAEVIIGTEAHFFNETKIDSSRRVGITKFSMFYYSLET